MEYNQKFIPEGWDPQVKAFSLEELNSASKNGSIMQAKVTKCDSNYNLYLDLGNNITGIIPREEIEAVSVDEAGFPKPSLCINKVDKYVQFKVKDVSKKDTIILSRKAVGKEAISWIKNDLKEGMQVLRNYKKHKTIWSFCRNRWRSCRVNSYRRYFCCQNKKPL